ncbi:MAG: polysaccharide biosynthesis protein [Clostridiales bacterium]|jgi:FlaA1/EpsC-like NDP-sugar epimerase|nr:polysaccharide biosynthesis protein [Clostridiales bacterium]
MKRKSVFTAALFAALDCLFCWMSWVGSVFVFTYLFVTEYSMIITANQNIPVMIAACVLFYGICGVYKSMWQYPGIGTVIRLAAAVLLASLSVYVSFRVRLGYWPNPGLGMMAFYFLLTMSAALRLFKRFRQILGLYLRRLSKTQKEPLQEPVRTILVGAGESAAAFLLNTSQQGPRQREILAVVDNDPNKHGYSLHGVRILGDDTKIPQLINRFDIREVVIAVPSMKNEDLRRIVRLAPASRCKVRVLSGLSADKAQDMLRDINIGDLLGRPEAAIDVENIGEWVRGKTVLVTGGGGSIGSELCRQLLRFDVGKVVIFDISENNAYNLKEELKLKFDHKGRYKVAVRIGSVQDEKRLDEVFREFKPAIVFHAAAYKHVPLMEECPRLALDNNVIGTLQTARCACRHGAGRFVMISTDKAVNPTNVMGATKRLAERLVLEMNGLGSTEFVCVRFGNVLDSNGSVVPLFKRQIEAGGPVTVTHPDIIRYFMTISEAARLVMEAGAMAEGGEVFILDMGLPVKITDLAENLIRMAGMIPGVDIHIEYTGLRPGEKLYEELLLNEEGIKKTLREKIFVVKPEILEGSMPIAEEVQKAMAGEGDMRSVLKRFVPEYTYNLEEHP